MARGNILLIDDEESVRMFLQDFFEDRDFNVTTATNGVEGVEFFGKGSFDLVLCDMLMPQMIGLEVLRRIKQVKPDQKVIMLTSIKEGSMKEKVEALGCHLYLNKPIRLADLEVRVSECFSASS